MVFIDFLSFWIFLLFLDRFAFFGSFDFFVVFLSIFGFFGSCRMWHQSGELFLGFSFFKNVENVKKVEKNVKKGVKKKGSKLDLFVPPPKNTKNRVF